MNLDEIFGPQDAYGKDAEALRLLGLKTNGFGRDWTDLGTVVVEEADPDGEYGPRPAATVKVEVSSMPVLFWRFTITRPRDESTTVDGKVVGVYEPLEKFVMSTGSGTFCEYYPMAEMVAMNMVGLEVSA